MTANLPVPTEYRYRSEVPREHKATMDTRLQWMWNQRLGTIQTIWQKSRDVQDRTVADLILQAIWGSDLTSIELILSRLEGGPQSDEETLKHENVSIRI